MVEKKELHQYDDIINLEHPTSKKHPRMSRYNRAAQFSPFAALTGHEAAVKETERLTTKKVELDETQKMKLDEKLQIILRNIEENPTITITYFVPDEKKEGGHYTQYKGCLKKIDFMEHLLVMNDANHTSIPVEQIYEIESELFSRLL